MLTIYNMKQQSKKYSIDSKNFKVDGKEDVEDRDYSIEIISLMLRDSPDKINKTILERYFNDIYNMLLKKLTELATGERVTKSDLMKMHSLLDEMMKVRTLLEIDDF